MLAPSGAQDRVRGFLAACEDDAAFGAWYDDAAPRVYAFAYARCGDDHALALECLLAGGDDYELCFTAPRGAAERVAAIAASTAVPLTRIGMITAGSGLVVRDERGMRLPAVPRAYDHFA